MLVKLDSIHFPAQERLRKEYGDLTELAASIAKYGQLQDILLRRAEGEEEKEFVLVDGGRRFLAISLLQKRDASVPDGNGGFVPAGQIGAKLRGEEDELYSLELEYHANEDRKNLDWKEKFGYIRRVHEGHKARNPRWTLERTAELLETTTKTISTYLDFLDEPEAFKSERVQEADSFRTARKQFEIERENLRRHRAVEHREKERAREAERRDFDPTEFASEIIQLGDCRKWIRQFPDESFDWVHWDPPYGGEQGGGALTAHTRIDDTWESAQALQDEMFVQIERVLRRGGWLVLWYHPAKYSDIVFMLKQAGFWVNPYPNIWFKPDRMASGQEIKRFLVNAYETFLFACKSDDPILVKHNRQNVFPYKSIERSARRHSMHKPPGLLAEILECISIRGELGCDPSSGSGSILEAALGGGRRAIACEIESEFRNASVEVVAKLIEERKIKPYSLDRSERVIPTASGEEEIDRIAEEYGIDLEEDIGVDLSDL